MSGIMRIRYYHADVQTVSMPHLILKCITVSSSTADAWLQAHCLAVIGTVTQGLTLPLLLSGRGHTLLSIAERFAQGLVDSHHLLVVKTAIGNRLLVVQHKGN